MQNKNFWINPSPNSPFSLCPIVLVVLQENRENVNFIMDTCINQQTTALIQNGISFPNGTVNILHHRSLIDTKMAVLLDGAGGAVCHLCTATMSQINDKEFITQGYPINRSIELAKQLFEEVDEKEFFQAKDLISRITLLQIERFTSFSFASIHSNLFMVYESYIPFAIRRDPSLVTHISES